MQRMQSSQMWCPALDLSLQGSPYWPRMMPGLVQTLRSRASSAAETRLISNGAEAAQQILNIADLYTQTIAAIR